MHEGKDGWIGWTERVGWRDRWMNKNQRSLYLDGRLEDVQWSVLVADGSGSVSDQLPVRTDPMRRRLRIPDGLAAQADLLTFHHKHLGGVSGYHRRLTNKLFLLGTIGLMRIEGFQTFSTFGIWDRYWSDFYPDHVAFKAFRPVVKMTIICISHQTKGRKNAIPDKLDFHTRAIKIWTFPPLLFC